MQEHYIRLGRIFDTHDQITVNIHFEIYFIIQNVRVIGDDHAYFDSPTFVSYFIAYSALQTHIKR